MKKILVLLFCFLVLLLTACGGPEKKAEKPAEPTKKEEPAKPAEPAKNAEGKQVLNLFSWADNFDPEVLADFEKKFNCKINYDVFANNEELLAKIQAGGARYDVIQPSDYMITTMLKLNLLEELDMSKIPNTKNLIKDLQAPAYDPTGTHSVVYSWGITGIAYNKKYVKTPPTSWRDLWNPAYKGRVVLLNDVREVISFAMKMHGHSLNSVDKNHLAECMKDLKALAPNILAYDTDTIKQKFIAEEAYGYHQAKIYRGRSLDRHHVERRRLLQLQGKQEYRLRGTQRRHRHLGRLLCHPQRRQKQSPGPGVHQLSV